MYTVYSYIHINRLIVIRFPFSPYIQQDMGEPRDRHRQRPKPTTRRPNEKYNNTN